jgi:hypothetical protein
MKNEPTIKKGWKNEKVFSQHIADSMHGITLDH